MGSRVDRPDVGGAYPSHGVAWEAHPSWCDEQRCTALAGVGLHRSRLYGIPVAGSRATVLEVSLWQGAATVGEEDAPPYVELLVSDDGHPATIDLLRPDAAALGHVLCLLIAVSGGEQD